MNAADQQRIEQQREAYRLSQTQGIPQPSRDSAVQTHVNPRLFSVDAIMNVQGQRLAIINGVSYAEKTVKNGIHVHRIFEGFVTLTLEESEQWGRAQVGVRYSSESWPDAIPNRVKLLKAN
ncbi:hypothetical protein [Thiomicrospira microaerophila]|uniref:hypothetical protein n=1 Tax=Thiomicrospira microaerophila TaxID=406020 RepID=UPI0012FDEA02|nr:hypothetical protein [Thiomicrospira microaerophila]